MAYKTENRKGVSDWIEIIRKYHPKSTEAELRKLYGHFPHAVTAIEKLKKRAWFSTQ